MRKFFVVMLLLFFLTHCPAVREYRDQVLAYAGMMTDEKAEKMIKLIELKREWGL